MLTIGITQGKSEAPLICRLVLEEIMRSLLNVWRSKGWGICFQPLAQKWSQAWDRHHWMTAIWADNIYVAAKGTRSAQQMTHELQKGLRTASWHIGDAE